MLSLNEDIRFIKGIGEKRAQSLSKLSIDTLRSLICAFPRRYDDRSIVTAIRDVSDEGYFCICAMVATAPVVTNIRKGMELTKFRAVDDSGSVDVTFFNQGYIKSQLIVGEYYRFYGKFSVKNRFISLAAPIFERADGVGFSTGRIVPIYALTAGISNTIMMKSMSTGLTACGENFPDYLPSYIAEQYSMAQSRFAYNNIHFPEDYKSLEIARRRLIFEELFVFAVALKMMGRVNSRLVGEVIDAPNIAEFYTTLPFSPTGAQRRAVDEALCDMQTGFAMNRLVQGDVGSGKTLVAAACIWALCRAGKQCAFMAPTQILAEQHYKTLSEFFAPFGIEVCLLTGSIPAKQKRLNLANLQSGEISLAVGTHALISDDIIFKNLSLVITDEQHRFGVSQRTALAQKGNSPHTLVMSATPIPRTLALMLYGDLQVSIIDELPPNRQRVDTFTVGESYRRRIDAFIDKQCELGRQVFVVCPMVEDGDDNDLHSAEQMSKQLAQSHKNLRVACIHGRMKAKMKEKIMREFAEHESDVLVSTTVIEVGVDVPNASLMVVENADRFGLSQLHQLRGRVGRGSHKSYCILISDNRNPETHERLLALCKTNDGFKLAEEDLKMRGPGDFFGLRQHGLPQMRIADLCTDIDVLNDAKMAADLVLKNDPTLAEPVHKKLHERLGELFEIKQNSLN